jgi:hypothetical protein
MSDSHLPSDVLPPARKHEDDDTTPTALTARAEKRAKAAYPWRGAKPFQPGQSGNPGGMSRFYYECRRIARDASPEMMRGLIELARTAQDERVKSVALIAVLDRAGIRPVDYDPNAEQSKYYDNMSLEERKARLAELVVRSAQMLGIPLAVPEPPPTENGHDPALDLQQDANGVDPDDLRSQDVEINGENPEVEK